MCYVCSFFLYVGILFIVYFALPYFFIVFI